VRISGCRSAGMDVEVEVEVEGVEGVYLLPKALLPTT